MSVKLIVYTVVSQVFSQNTFIAQIEGGRDCLVVDPGFDTQALGQFLAEHQLVPAAILNTHGHIDHIAGNQALKTNWPDCPLVIGAHEAEKLLDPQLNLSEQFGAPLTSPPADVLVHEGEIYTAAGLDLEVLEIPGHSRGHVVFVWKGDRPWTVFGGDVLFQGSVGRTDFPDGDTNQLLTAIRQKLFVLPEDTVVLPGHGDRTTIGAEKRFNPYVGQQH